MWVVISGILGILGFLISLINLIQYLLSRRINLEIQIKECVLRPYARGQKKLILHYQTNNKSNLPITITDLQVILDSGIYDETTFTFEVLALEHVRNGKVYLYPLTTSIYLSIFQCFLHMQVISSF